MCNIGQQISGAHWSCSADSSWSSISDSCFPATMGSTPWFEEAESFRYLMPGNLLGTLTECQTQSFERRKCWFHSWCQRSLSSWKAWWSHSHHSDREGGGGPMFLSSFIYKKVLTIMRNNQCAIFRRFHSITFLDYFFFNQENSVLSKSWDWQLLVFPVWMKKVINIRDLENKETRVWEKKKQHIFVLTSNSAECVFIFLINTGELILYQRREVTSFKGPSLGK